MVSEWKALLPATNDWMNFVNFRALFPFNSFSCIVPCPWHRYRWSSDRFGPTGLQQTTQTSISDITVWWELPGNSDQLAQCCSRLSQGGSIWWQGLGRLLVRSSCSLWAGGVFLPHSQPLLYSRLMPCSVVHIKLCLLSQHLFSLIKRQRSDQLCPILFIELNFAEEKLQAGLGKASPSSRCVSAVNGCAIDGMRWRGRLLYRIQSTAWYAKLTMICPRWQLRRPKTDGKGTQTAELSSFFQHTPDAALGWNGITTAVQKNTPFSYAVYHSITSPWNDINPCTFRAGHSNVWMESCGMAPSLIIRLATVLHIQIIICHSDMMQSPS